MRKKLLISLSFMIVLSSCDYYENRWINVSNHSKSKIVVFVSKKETGNLLKDERVDEIMELDCDSTGLLSIVRPTWDEYIKRCQDNKIRFYIIKNDSIDKYGWKTVLKKNIYNKKYLFTIEDLEELKWEIKYE